MLKITRLTLHKQYAKIVSWSKKGQTMTKKIIKAKGKELLTNIMLVALIGLAMYGMIQGLAQPVPTWFDKVVGVVCTILIAKVALSK